MPFLIFPLYTRVYLLQLLFQIISTAVFFVVEGWDLFDIWCCVDDDFLYSLS